MNNTTLELQNIENNFQSNSNLDKNIEIVYKESDNHNNKKEEKDEDIKEETSYFFVMLNILGIFISLYGFLFSLDLMGDSFKILGGRTAGDLFKNIENPIAGLMIGILATVLVQSSSTSTSVMVGMVGADIISVKTAIPLIMGANIGTSVTNSIVSIGQMHDKDQRERAFSGAVVHDFLNFVTKIFPLFLYIYKIYCLNIF